MKKKKEKRTKNVGTPIKPFNIVKSNSNPHIGKQGAKTLSVTAGDVIMFHYTMNHGNLKDIVPPSTSIYNPSRRNVNLVKTCPSEFNHTKFSNILHWNLSITRITQKTIKTVLTKGANSSTFIDHAMYPSQNPWEKIPPKLEIYIFPIKNLIFI